MRVPFCCLLVPPVACVHDEEPDTGICRFCGVPYCGDEDDDEPDDEEPVWNPIRPN